MSPFRVPALVVLGLLAVIAQTAVLGQLSVSGITPDLALLVVVALAVIRGADVAALAGFVAGLALDLAPPSDHVAGRWALALTVAGYAAGRLLDSRRTPLEPRETPSRRRSAALVGGASLLTSTVFLLSGLVVHDLVAEPGRVVAVVVVGSLIDAALAALLLPALVGLVRRLQPARLA